MIPLYLLDMQLTAFCRKEACISCQYAVTFLDTTTDQQHHSLVLVVGIISAIPELNVRIFSTALVLSSMTHPV